jgi:outer membrane protein assembly factor BamB
MGKLPFSRKATVVNGVAVFTSSAIHETVTRFTWFTHSVRSLAVLMLVQSVTGTRAVSAQALADKTVKTPSSWLQLRGGVDNTGAVAGLLNVGWRFKAPRPVRGIAVAQGLVLIGTESADADAAMDNFSDDQHGYLIALEASTGKKIWIREVPSWIHGDPVVFGGRVVVNYGRWPMTHPGGVMAVDLRTGRSLWSLSIDAGVMPAPAIDSARNTVSVAGGDGILYTLSLASGVIQRMTGLESADAMSSPRIDTEGIIYLGTAETIRSYSTRTGEAKWHFRPPALRAVGDVPVALADSIVLTTGTRAYGFWNAFRALPIARFGDLLREAVRTRKLSTYRSWFQEQWLVAISRRAATPIWQRALGVGLSIPRNTSGTPVVSNEMVIVSSPISRVVSAFVLKSGKLLWSRHLDSTHRGAVTVFGTNIILGEKNGTLLLLRLSDGEVVGQCSAGAPFTVFAPVVVGSTLFFATHDGWVRAVPYETLLRQAGTRSAMPCF